MKKNQLLFFALLTLLVACQNDDDDNFNSQDIVGNWELSGLGYSGTSTNGPLTSNFSGVGIDFNAAIEFTAQGTYATNGSYTVALTTTTLGQSTTNNIPVSFTEALSNGTYEINGNTITFTQDGESFDYSIAELSNNSLKLEYTTDTNNQGAATNLQGFFELIR